jgi:signal transduction histidine kinase
MEHRPRPPQAGWWRLVAVVTASGYAVASVIVLGQHGERVTSYFAVSSLIAGVGLLAGLGLVAVGAAVTLDGSRASLGPLSMLVGCAWLLPIWVGWETGPEAVRSVAMLAAPMLLPLVVHLVAASPFGRTATPSLRRVVVAGYIVVGLLTVARALVRDPFLDLHCWSNCTDNTLLVHADPGLARILDVTLLSLALAIALVTTAATVVRVARARATRRLLTAAAVPASLFLLADAGVAVLLLRDPAEGPELAGLTELFVIESVALSALAAGVLWVAWTVRTARARVTDLARELGKSPEPGSLRAALARSLNDHSVAVRYWLSQQGRYVDGAGRPAPPSEDDRRAKVLVVRGEDPVAVVLHDPDLVGSRTLEEQIGSAARLVIDNERLRAQSLAQLSELRESRARIVTAADSLRRGLERDLHDGAQQRLIAMNYELRLARADAEASQDVELASRLDAALDQAVEALADLREFAHGVFPAVLDESGLANALWSLADRAAVPVDVDADEEERFPAAAERAAYIVAKVAMETPDASTDDIVLAVRRDREDLVLEVEGVGEVDSVHLSDRVGAVGGCLEVEPGHVRVVIPCE